MGRRHVGLPAVAEILEEGMRHLCLTTERGTHLVGEVVCRAREEVEHLNRIEAVLGRESEYARRASVKESFPDECPWSVLVP